MLPERYVGNLKAWSNWKPGDTKNPFETITVSLPDAFDVGRVVTWFYGDGNNISFAETLSVESQDADGNWIEVSGEVSVGAEGLPVVDVPIVAPLTSAINVVMTARPSGYLTLSEIEVYAKAPGLSADASLSSIEVNGLPIPHFDPAVYQYAMTAHRPRHSVITATASDPYARVEITYSCQLEQMAVITVTSEDGVSVTKYQVALGGRGR